MDFSRALLRPKTDFRVINGSLNCFLERKWTLNVKVYFLPLTRRAYLPGISSASLENTFSIAR